MHQLTEEEEVAGWLASWTGHRKPRNTVKELFCYSYSHSYASLRRCVCLLGLIPGMHGCVCASSYYVIACSTKQWARKKEEESSMAARETIIASIIVFHFPDCLVAAVVVVAVVVVDVGPSNLRNACVEKILNNEDSNKAGSRPSSIAGASCQCTVVNSDWKICADEHLQIIGAHVIIGRILQFLSLFLFLSNAVVNASHCKGDISGG